MAADFNDPNLTRLMIVDDDEIVLSSAKEQLTLLGYHVTAVNHPQLALQHLQTENFSVILADYEMPEMDGLQLFGVIEESHPDTSRLIFSSGIGMMELSEAIASGRVYRHVSKPWLKEDMQATVGNAMERYRLLKTNETLQARNITLSQKLATAGESVPAAEPTAEGAPDSDAPVLASADAEDLALQAINKVLYTFHPNLGNSAKRALAICQTLGEILEMDPKDSRNLCIAAQLHDIGLIANEVAAVRRWMRDPEKCSEEELAEINKHPEKSEEMLDFYPGFEGAKEVVRAHHENWDGTGYPDKLKAETIPYLSRLLAPIIFFCHQHHSSVQLMTMMESMSEHQFDPDAVRALAKAIPMTKMPKGIREVLLIELNAGMILARDINNTSGMKLLPKGRELTDGAINKVLSINRMAPISPLCLVYC
jgi:response regulator RpfG family c-di-GMP phosphodiesterase